MLSKNLTFYGTTESTVGLVLILLFKRGAFGSPSKVAMLQRLQLAEGVTPSIPGLSAEQHRLLGRCMRTCLRGGCSLLQFKHHADTVQWLNANLPS